MNKKALIFGVTGQTGSYLTELLLSQGYEVHGVIRRSSSFNTGRIEHLRNDVKIYNKRLFLHYGDLTDALSVNNIVSKLKPNYIFNLGAQSHVKTSFEIPEYTTNVDALGQLHVLEAAKNHAPEARIYNAATSELYGGIPELMPPNGYNELSSFYPRSPYGVAKQYAFWITKNYRESYSMHASNGILFNHETIAEFMPMIFKIGKESNEIDIKPISEIVKWHTKNNAHIGSPAINNKVEKYQETSVETNLYVWDKVGWTRVKYASGYPHSLGNKKPKFIISKKGAVFATSSHHHIMEDGSEKEFGEINIKDKISLVSSLPDSLNDAQIQLTTFVAKLIGFIVGDGNVSRPSEIRLTAKNKDELKEYENYWVSLGKNAKYTAINYGFNKKNIIWQLSLSGATKWVATFLPDLYTESKEKRVPKIILNSTKELMEAFLEGYNDADGLKKNKCTYKFKNFTTNSATLALGLIYLLEKTTEQKINVNVEKVFKFNRENLYYKINVLSDSRFSLNFSKEKYEIVKTLLGDNVSLREISKKTNISRKFIQKVARGYIPTGDHWNLVKENQVKKIINFEKYDGWFYDLETESNTFHCGVGYSHVHNSPRRTPTFVTRKITKWVGENIKKIQSNKEVIPLELGNFGAVRDWGHAKDYANAIALIANQEKPEDYVVATGETHTVKEFLEKCFQYFNLNVSWSGSGLDEIGLVNNEVITKVNPCYFRPAEVFALKGDATKIKNLGWKPEYTFDDLIKEMIENDLK